MAIVNCNIGESSIIRQPDLVNLFGCTIGELCSIAAFVEIGPGCEIGDNVRIQAHAFIPAGVRIGSNVLIGPGVRFTNDRWPPSGPDNWQCTTVRDGCVIGANATIVAGVEIGRKAVVGAGTVVVSDVMPYTMVVGNPARLLRLLTDEYWDNRAAWIRRMPGSAEGCA